MVFLNFSLLLVYRNTIGYCILILYPETLLNSLISSDSFFCYFPRISYIGYHVTCGGKQFYFLLPNWIPCIYLTRTSIILLNRCNGADRHLLLIRDVRGKAFSLSQLSLIISCRFILDCI